MDFFWRTYLSLMTPRTISPVTEEGKAWAPHARYCLCGPGFNNKKGFCGQDFLGDGGNPYAAVVASDFCLEPPGDTTTRSHFYLVRMLLPGDLRHICYSQGLAQPLINPSSIFCTSLLLTPPRLYWADVFQ